MNRARTASLCLGFLIAAGQASSAQSGTQRAQVQMEDVQLAWCLDFLIDPAMSEHLLPRGWSGLPASAAVGLPAGLVRTFDEDAKYKDWFPGRVCAISARSSSIGGSPVINDKPRRPPTIGWFQVAGKRGDGRPEVAQPMLATNTFRIRSPLSGLTVKLDDMAFETGPDPDKDIVGDGLVAKLGNNTISWRGYLSPDSTAAPAADTLRATFQNDLDRSYDVIVVRQGGTGNLVAGLVSVAGKGDLAKAINRSPIRLMSRVQTGGTASFTFLDNH